MPAAVLGSLKMVFVPAVAGGADGALGGAVVGLSVVAPRVGVVGPLALVFEFDDLVATKPPMAPPTTMAIARTIITILVVDRPLLPAGAA
jgi:hypothetical protein